MLTCLSCANYRPTRCLDNLIAWPNAVLADCWSAQYEPGSDEAEDLDQTDRQPTRITRDAVRQHQHRHPEPQRPQGN